MENNMRILVVDDTPANLMVLSGMLARMGYETIQANSGEAAVNLYRQYKPDMVLMDVVMPGMNGYEAVREIRRIAREWIPIVFVTASATGKDDLVESVKAGGDDYLLKPVDFKVLQAKIGTLFQRLWMSRQLDEQNRLLLDYRRRTEEEQHTAQEFMRRLLALDRINDPLVRFHLQAAEIFSGDLIAVARTPANHLYAMLADSTGHGLTAALAVMPVLHTFHAMAEKGFGIESIAAEINLKIAEVLPTNRFVAAVLVALEPEFSRISVWNGGCPPAILLDQDGEIACRFDSMHLPLGILPPEKFGDELKHYHYGNKPCQLLLCSDGAVDAADAASMDVGMDRLLQAARSGNAEDRLPAMIGMLERRLGGAQAQDDITMISLRCPVEDQPPRIPAGRKASAQSAASMAEVLPGQEQAAVEWQFSLLLAALQLRNTDIVPLLLHVVGQIEHEGGQALSGKLFLLLSELFNNALDHGLLRLDSVLKDDPQGMERYFEERALRLSRLQQGEIRIELTRISPAGGPCLKVCVTDSGGGFDYSTQMSAIREDDLRRHGRGLALVKSLSGQLHFTEGGRTVHVCIPLRGPEQCGREGQARCGTGTSMPVAVAPRS